MRCPRGLSVGQGNNGIAAAADGCDARPRPCSVLGLRGYKTCRDAADKCGDNTLGICDLTAPAIADALAWAGSSVPSFVASRRLMNALAQWLPLTIVVVNAQRLRLAASGGS